MTLGLIPLILLAGGNEPEATIPDTCYVWEDITKKGTVVWVKGFYGYALGENRKESLEEDYPRWINPFLLTHGYPALDVTYDLIIDSEKAIKSEHDYQNGVKSYTFPMCHDAFIRRVVEPVEQKLIEEPKKPKIKQDTTFLPPVVLQDTTKGPDIVIQDTIPGQPIIVQDTIILEPEILSLPEGPKGLFAMDKNFGSIGVFYRDDRERDEKYLAMNPKLNFFIPLDKNKADIGLGAYVLNNEKGDENFIGKGRAGIHTSYAGGGVEISSDIDGRVDVGPYAVVGIPLQYVTIGAKGEVGINANENIKMRPSLEGFIFYRAPRDNFRFKLSARNGVDLLKGHYVNKANLDFMIGSLLFGLEGKTNKGAEIWPHEEVGNVIKSIEGKAYIGGRWKLDKNTGLYLKGHVSGKHDRDRTLKAVEGGIELGLDFY
ncbi:MAG: hypothetical protein IB618_00260 [Candidatus Pacearchaeota archaeon]|nr:MAG: hypothetical protein IB618_00260 [Candidatus Pacearchaeota archaeon]